VDPATGMAAGGGVPAGARAGRARRCSCWAASRRRSARRASRTVVERGVFAEARRLVRPAVAARGPVGDAPFRDRSSRSRRLVTSEYLGVPRLPRATEEVTGRADDAGRAGAAVGYRCGAGAAIPTRSRPVPPRTRCRRCVRPDTLPAVRPVPRRARCVRTRFRADECRGPSAAAAACGSASARRPRRAVGGAAAARGGRVQRPRRLHFT
jgi:hypothetical protein